LTHDVIPAERWKIDFWPRWQSQVHTAQRFVCRSGSVLQICNQGRDHDLPGILVHDDGHTAQIQSVSLGREAFAEPISDMVGTKQGGNDDQYVRGGQSEGDGVPRCEDVSLEFEISILAAGEVGSGVTQG
jgi:hypothetical protein